VSGPSPRAGSLPAVPTWDPQLDNWLWRTEPQEPGPAIVFDMDGVLSDASSRQHFIEYPFPDWEAFFHACGDDDLIAEVARLLDVIDAEHRIILLTARPIRVQPQTLAWLDRYDLRWDALIMREYGDYMAARVFKQRTVGELRARGFDLRLAFEDDPRNVHMFHTQDVPCIYIHSGYYE
jgi:hypothetical protein